MPARDDCTLPFIFVPDGSEAPEALPAARALHVRATLVARRTGSDETGSDAAAADGKAAANAATAAGVGEGEPIRRPGDWPHDPNDRMDTSCTGSE